MNTKLIIGATALLSLAAASCSSDQDPQVPSASKGKEIRFAAQSPALSRAVTTTANISSFNVYAYTGGEAFMRDVAVTKNATNQWTYSPTQYWPSSPVNFYAYSPASWSDGTTPMDPTQNVDYYDEYGNTDLVYSVLMDQTQTATPVTFNFRHALSQVKVDLRTDSADRLDIKVSKVILYGVRTKGVFTFPSESTSAGGTAAGTWSEQTGEATYIYYIDDQMVLTDAPQSANIVTEGLLVPQTLGTMSLTQDKCTGDYIEVDCIIYDKASGNQVWPNSDTPPSQNIQTAYENTGRLYFPVLAGGITQWQNGYRYNYVLTINEPAELKEIEFGNPTVDTYTDVTVTPEAATL